MAACSALLFPLPDCYPFMVAAASLNAVTKSKRRTRKKLVSSWKDSADSCSCSSSYYGSSKFFLKCGSFCYLSSSIKTSSLGNNGNSEDDDDVRQEEAEYPSNEIQNSEDISSEHGITIQVIKLEKRSRRIESSVEIDASLNTVWKILTDYERLADFVPGLAVSRLVEKTENYARLFQIGQQNLAFGLKFNAKGIIDCYEKDLKTLSFGSRREVDFKMVEGDFLTFEGKWSIEQYHAPEHEAATDPRTRQFHTILYYVVDVEPKRWLPVRLVEDRLCREIRTNLSCIREEAHRLNLQTLEAC
ncbi:hypothetical protein Droror1_Dr00015446 [Drosera rotundifolia]